MKNIIVTFLLAISSALLYAQTAKEIIDKNIELSGGLTQWKLLNSVILSGKVNLGIKDEYPIKIYQQRPNLTKTSIIINRKETPIEGFDGKKGYAMNYATNKLQDYPNYTPENFDNDFIDWENKGFTAKYLGKEKLGNTLCHKVELTKNVNKTLYFFDAETYMLLREIKKEEIITYSDYKKVGTLSFAFRIEGSNPKQNTEYVIILNKIDINRVLPENTFKF